MPFNLLKKYNELLDIISMSELAKDRSLRGIFDRDIRNNPNFCFQTKRIHPTPEDGKDSMEILFNHLTRKTIDRGLRNREFDYSRSSRIHWIRFHIEEQKKHNILTFSVKEPSGFRTYIYDQDEEYIVVLEPLRNQSAYYLLSAFHLEGKDFARNKMMKKYKRKLPHLL